MTIPTSRAAFKSLCLQNLGAPVLQINVADVQVDNRIDQALYKWQEWHYDATERAFYPISVTEEDKTNQYVTIPEDIIGVYRVVNVGDARGLTNNLLSIAYQARVALIDMFNMFERSIIPYTMAMMHIELLDRLLSPQPTIEFNRHVNKLYLFTRWDRMFVGEYLVIEGRRIINSTQMWQDKWLQDYATALIKLQWGNNLAKYTAVQMPGGITFSGADLKAEAKAEIEALELELKNDLAEPLPFMIG